jgi:hypothetical protein
MSFWLNGTEATGWTDVDTAAVHGDTGWEWINNDAVGLARIQLLGMNGDGAWNPPAYTVDCYIDWGLFYISAEP